MPADPTPLIKTSSGRIALSPPHPSPHLLVENPLGSVSVALTLEQAEALSLMAPGQHAPQEIERKFLVHTLPDNVDDYPHTRLRQGYIIADPSATFRIRDGQSSPRLTLKTGHGVSRNEVEIRISEAQAEQLWPLAGQMVLSKRRYFIPGNQPEHPMELDVYEGIHEGLMVLEQEFSDLEDAKVWSPPTWVGQDITDDAKYTNAELARRIAEQLSI